LKEIALHILDIAENSIAAGANRVEITVEENLAGNRIHISVQDDGRGIDEQTLAHITDPFMTSRTTRVAGLGIPFFKAAAEACNGGLQIASTSGKGTRLEAEFERDHIDRMPLGDLAGTLLTLVVGFPEAHWLFHYRIDGQAFTFDNEPLKKELGDIPLTEPSILRFIREILKDGISSVQRAAADQDGRAALAKRDDTQEAKSADG
jgi:anti-sigma regulatory factor (Ser/Thr protein kinase)